MNWIKSKFLKLQKFNYTSKNKKIEILKYTNELKINEKFLDNLIKSNYSRIGVQNLSDFEDYMRKNNIDTANIKEKMTIETFGTTSL